MATVLAVCNRCSSCYDEPCLPTEQAQRIAVRTQQVIAYESGVVTPRTLWGVVLHRGADEGAEDKAWEYLHRIEDMGGAVAAIETGYVQREIQEASYAYQKAIDEGQKVNRGREPLQNPDEEPQMIFRHDPASEKAQIAAPEQDPAASETTPR